MRKRIFPLVLLFMAAGGTAFASLSLTPGPGYGPYLYTENFGPNGVGLAEGWFLSVGTFVYDPNGVPGNITSVTASQPDGANVLPMIFFYKLPFFAFWGVENFRLPYDVSGPTGSWTITAVNADGDVATAETHVLDRPAKVPTTPVRFEFLGGRWWVLWDFAPFRAYANGVDQIEIRILRSPEDTLFRLLFTLGPPNPPEIFGIAVPPQALALNEPLWFRVMARDLDRSETGSPVENRSSSFGYFNPNPAPGFETLECTGFEAPMDKSPVDVRNRRVLPLKVRLSHQGGAPVIGSDLGAPPVLRVIFVPSSPGPSDDVTEFVLSAGLGSDDRFVFTDEGTWQFNLSTVNYTAPGIYTLRIQTGDAAEYIINPGCVTRFVLE